MFNLIFEVQADITNSKLDQTGIISHNNIFLLKLSAFIEINILNSLLLVHCRVIVKKDFDPMATAIKDQHPDATIPVKSCLNEQETMTLVTPLQLLWQRITEAQFATGIDRYGSGFEISTIY